MALSTRRILLITRLLAGVVAWFGRKWAFRGPAWAVHDFLWLYPTLRRNCAWHGPVVTRFQTEAREVWLTIDDGPDPETTPLFLDLLREHGVRATFFVIGSKVDAHRDLVRRIRAEGHELANHTHRHPAGFWWLLPRSLAAREISRCELSLRAATGERSRYFRSPVGMNNAGIHPVAARAGLQIVGWSADGADGCCTVPSIVVRRIRKKLAPGAIVLLHEGGDARRRALTLRQTLEMFHEEGYRCVHPPAGALLS